MPDSVRLLRRLLPFLSIGVLAAVMARQAEETRRARQAIDLLAARPESAIESTAPSKSAWIPL
jgi:hypothetical protein